MSSSSIESPGLPDLAERLSAGSETLMTSMVGRCSAENEDDTPRVLAALKSSGASALAIPERFGGRGATSVQAVRFQVALASLAPSAAVGTTMHHYKIAALSSVALDGSESASIVLGQIAQRCLLLASGGAESIPDRDIGNPESVAVRDGDGYRVTGRKQPCSLSESMDMISLLVQLREPDGTFAGFGQAFVEADAPGVERARFWNSPVFLGAESHSVRLSDVRMPADHLVSMVGAVGSSFATRCYIWFQILISASYMGVGWCIASATSLSRRDRPLWTEAATALTALEGEVLEAARAVDADLPLADQLNISMRARDQVEDLIHTIGSRFLRAGGGAAFANSGLPCTLTGALNAISFHPPQRGSRTGLGLESLAPDLQNAI